MLSFVILKDTNIHAYIVVTILQKLRFRIYVLTDLEIRSSNVSFIEARTPFLYLKIL
jgi:hypothetical protein